MRSVSLAPAALHAGPNMTPLVDVVLVILIFLMLAGSFGIRERFLETQLSVVNGTSSVEKPTMVVSPTQLDIHVRPAGGGYVMQVAGGASTLDTDVLTSQLAVRRAQFIAAGLSADDVQIVIRPTGDAPWQPTLATFDAALRADFKKVSFAAAK